MGMNIFKRLFAAAQFYANLVGLGTKRKYFSKQSRKYLISLYFVILKILGCHKCTEYNIRKGMYCPAIRGCSQIISAAEGGGWGRKIMAMADKGGGGLRQMLTMAEKGGRGGKENADIS